MSAVPSSPRPSGRVALVTGATAGIGLEVARTLAQDGHRVLVCSRRPDAVAATVKELAAADLDVDGTACDVTSVTDIDRMVSSCVDRFGPIDILVNNAGCTNDGATAEMADKMWYDVIDVNLNSVFLVTKRVLTAGGMLQQPTGRIINVASIGGKQGVLGAAPYTASKHGVVGFSRALGLELARTGITVNAVCPGFVETPMAARVRERYAQLWQVDEEQADRRIVRGVPIGRYVTPAEVAGMVRYLVDDCAAAVTAQALNICGALGKY